MKFKGFSVKNCKKQKKKTREENEKKNKGITLIALVITIIVILILAGVTMNTLFGGDSVLEKAKMAKDKTKIATEEEQRGMARYEAVMNLENMEYEDVEGNTATIPAGFAPTRIEGESLIREGLVITDSEGNEFVWVPVPQAIGTVETETVINYMEDEKNTPMAKKNEENYIGIKYGTLNSSTVQVISSNYQEPGVVTGSGNQYDAVKENLTKAGIKEGSSDAFKKQMQDDYNKMVESVEKYGGFYVARYEMSYDVGKEKAQYKKGEKSWINGTTNNTEKDHWYGYYKKQREFVNNNYVKSSMIWDSQYDAMMFWMARNNINLKDESLNLKRNMDKNNRKTGSIESDKLLNIYDLLGNSKEWTMGAFGINQRTFRSGSYADIHYLVTSNQCFPTGDFDTLCSRATLYMVDI